MDIRKALDEHGVEITPNPAYHSGTVTCALSLSRSCVCVADLSFLAHRHPEPFPCDIRPRSEKARTLILDSCTASGIRD